MNITLADLARRKYFENKAKYYSLSDTNPDYVEHEFIYIQKYSDGFMDGFEMAYESLTGKSLRSEVMKQLEKKSDV
jgi:hypothetical protein